jgi:ribonucleoside-diphosphate reductase alpha chain
VLAEREALLGIGMTGMLDAPHIACNPEYQRKVAGMIKTWNIGYAACIGINPAGRATCVKPSGTTSLELGCVGSGHHAHHARRYIRRVIADELEYVFQAFKTINPHMCVRKPDGKWVIEFPVAAPAGATVKDDLGAIQFLDMVKSTQQNWVIPGTSEDSRSPGLNHNVSNTVSVRPEEWDKVAEYLWENREFFTGVSLLASSGDKDFAFAPNEAVITQTDETRWNTILESYVPIDYMTLVEDHDDTDLRSEAACAGGFCSIV